MNGEIRPAAPAYASPYVDKLDPWSSHSLIRERLRRFPPGARVLDVGAATGTLGRLCQGSGLILSALEPDPGWAQRARVHYQDVRACSIDEAPDDFLAGYDVVVCADVLEHLPRPEQALSRLAALQGPQAVFLVSVPNVANLWVRLNLLFGRFEYAERGILDRTHLRFFTRSSFLRLAAGAGLAPAWQRATPVPLPLVSPFFGAHPLGRTLHGSLAALTRVFPGLLGYQFVSELVKSI